MEQFNLSLIQTSLHWQDKPANFHHFESLVSRVTEADLIVLPEMFTTGFSMRPQELWDEPQGKTLEWMQSMAEKTHSAICGSAIIRDEGKFYNRLFFVKPDGGYHTYDKKHLFTLAGEEKIYAPGTGQLIVEYKGWKIMPFICYDLRFPVWCRNTSEVDLQLYIANWPERRAPAWKSLLQARSIENMCYVAGLNRVGEDGNGVSHSGDSAVYDELGKPVLSLTPSQQEIQSVELDRQRMLQSRERFQFLADRDRFQFLD